MGLLTSLWPRTQFRSSSGVEEPFLYRAWKWLWQRRGKRGWQGNLFDRIETSDWDLLIILDACRFDTLSSISDCAVIDKAVSPSSATPQFLQRANERGIFDGSVYVSANPQSSKHSPGRVKQHVAVFEEGWSERLSTVPAEAVYHEAVDHVKNGERVVAHTLQPHYPHVCHLNGRTIPVQNGLHPTQMDSPGRGDVKLQPMLASQCVDLDRARRSYKISVQYAWEHAKAVVADLTANGYNVAITSDHGELFGEYGFVEHPNNVKVAPLIEVPWIEFKSGRDDDVTVDNDIHDQLTALGYTE